MGKVKCWSSKQLKKARWKRSLARARKRSRIYGGFFCISDERELRPLTEEEERKVYERILGAIQKIKEVRIGGQYER